MNPKLPKVYANPDSFNLNHNMAENSINNSSFSNRKIDEILDSSNKYLFNHRYLITLKNNKVVESSIISKYNNKLLTIDNDVLDIDDIKSIVEIKK